MHKTNYKFHPFSTHPLLLLTILLLTVGTNFYSASPALAQSASTSVTDCTAFGDTGETGTLADALATSSTINFDCTGTIIVPEILVTSDLTINGQEGVILSGNGENRILSIAEDASVEINDLMLESGNGNVFEVAIGGVGEGGAIYNAGTLAVNNSTIRDSRLTTEGSGIYNVGGLKLNSVTIDTAAGSGSGAIFNSGDVRAQDLTMKNLSADGGFAALFNQSNMIVDGCLIENTSSRFSLAIGNSGTLELNDCVMRQGGSIQNFDGGSLSLTRSTIDSSGGGWVVDNAQGSALSLAAVTISNISGASIPIRNEGDATIQNSTISNNFLPNQSAINNSGTLTIKNSTITKNGPIGDGAVGGGIRNDGTLTLWDTIVADQGGGADCSGSEPITSNGYNLDSDGTCNLNSIGDIRNGYAYLEPLADNGGPTFTHALLVSPEGIRSEAINNGNCSDGTILTDQREVERPQRGACDIGAFELMDEASSPERAALIALYNSTDGDNWLDNTNWLEGDHCTWDGITCESGQVVEVELSSNQLTGTIPPEIGILSSLTELNLQNNPLSGTIPPEIGNLINLQFLLLSETQLSGSIPPEFGNLVSLSQLYIDNTQIGGAIPPEMGNLTDLVFLLLGRSQFSGAIPPELGNLTNLTTLVLYDNQLSGMIPSEIGSLENLLELFLNGNQFSGSLPVEMGNLTDLRELYLDSNGTDFCVPVELMSFVDQLGTYTSPPGEFCEGEPPISPNPNAIEIEAESGALSGGFTIGSDENASGGAYIFASSEVNNRGTMLDEEQKVTFTFNVAEDGIYRFAGIVNAPTVMSNSFYITVDDFPSQGYTWHNQVDAGYALEYVTDGPNIDMVERVLTAGEHTLTVYLREVETRLDKIIIERVSDVLAAPMPEGCDGLVREAEAGDWTGMFTVGADENASGGFYLHVPEGLGSRGDFPDAAQRASYCFTVEEPGTYRIKAWAYADNEFNNSFFVTVNDDTAANVGAYERAWHVRVNTEYAPEYVTSHDIANGEFRYPQIEVELDAGVHTVYFFLREDGTRLDKISLEPLNMTHRRMQRRSTTWPDGAHTFLPFLGR